MAECTCAQQRGLWTTVDNSCGKPSDLARPRSTPLQEINLLYLAELVDALSDAVELLGAKVDGLEYQLDAYWNAVESPLSPTEVVQRLRQIREQI